MATQAYLHGKLMKKLLLILAILVGFSICSIQNAFATTYTAGAGGGNWSAAATWGGGGFPGAADTAVLNATSGSVTVDVPSTCLNLTATNYNTNLVMTSTLTMATGGTCILPSGASGQLTGTGALILNGTNGLTTNNKAIPALTYGVAGTKTVSGTSDVTGLFTVSNATTQTGGVINVKGGMLLNANLAGSSTIAIYAGMMSGNGIISVNATPFYGSGAVTIAGGITLPMFDHVTNSYTGTFTINSGVLFVVTGTVTLNPSATYVSGGAGASLRLGGSIGYNMKSNGVHCPWDISFNTSATKTLSDNWTIDGQCTFLTSAGVLNGATLITNNNLILGTGVSGTTVIQRSGGAWTTTGAYAVANPMTFVGDSTATGTVYIGGAANNTYTYTRGTVSFATILLAGNAQLSGWNNITITSFGNSATATATIDSDITMSGALGISAATLTVNGAFHVYFGGNFGPSSGSCGIAGTAEFIMNGTGAWGNSSLTMNGKLTINTSGTVTIGNCVMQTNGTLKYVAGTIVNASGSNYINLYSSNTLDVSTMPVFWNILYITNTGTYTLASDLHANEIKFVAAYTATWSGAFNIYCTNLNSVAAGTGGCVFKIPDGKTLTVSSGIDFVANKGTTNTISSNTNGVKSYLNWTNAYYTNMFITRTNFTDIDASGSTLPIYTYNSGSSITRCVKVYFLSGYSINGGTTVTNF